MSGENPDWRRGSDPPRFREPRAQVEEPKTRLFDRLKKAPKEEKWRVVQEWVDDLPPRAQGTLLTGIRGCDLAPKEPENLETTPRMLTAFLRHCVINPADPREVDIPGGFFRSTPPPDGWKQSELGHFPLHWYSHVMHCFEVVGYYHPNQKLRRQAWEIYLKLVHGLHLEPESFETMVRRLTEDRIENKTVVS